MKKSAPAPSFRPLYEQIKILLTQSLVAGEWKPGEAIPSEMDLAARFRVSQGTGTFVASHSEPSYQYRFLRLMPDTGEKPHPQNLFFGLERAKAQGDAARALGLKPGAPVVGFKRVMSFGGRPVILDDIVFAAGQFPGLTLAELEEFAGSVYSFYETVFGVRMIRAEERVCAVAADSFAAAHLKVSQGAPLLRVDRVAYTYGDKPVEWRSGLCRTDGFSYYNELS